MTDPSVSYYIRCKRPACALLVEPTERVREVLEEEGWLEVDESCPRVHARVYAGVELREVVGR